MGYLTHLLRDALVADGEVALHLAALLHILLEHLLALIAAGLGRVHQLPEGNPLSLGQVDHHRVLVVLQRLHPCVHVGVVVLLRQALQAGCRTAEDGQLRVDGSAVVAELAAQVVAHAGLGLDVLVVVAALGKGVQGVLALHLAQVDGGGILHLAAQLGTYKHVGAIVLDELLEALVGRGVGGLHRASLRALHGQAVDGVVGSVGHGVDDLVAVVAQRGLGRGDVDHADDVVAV